MSECHSFWHETQRWNAGFLNESSFKINVLQATAVMSAAGNIRASLERRTREYTRRMKRRIETIPPQAMEALTSY